MVNRESNPRKQGDAGMGVAIGWFASNGYTVCVPLTDSQGYDLIVDDECMLKRVFVRTTTRKNGSGNWEAGLRTQGGNKSQFKIRKFDKDAVELVFIVCGDGSMFLIPSGKVECMSSITLGDKYKEYMLD